MKKSKKNVVDRISSLPDALIHDIFSFLDAKPMVQTSVLSNRWRHIWASPPYLNFNLTRSGLLSRKLSKSNISERDSFVDFVYRVLVVRDASCITHFTLNSQSVIDGRHVLTWLIAALSRNVTELHLLLTQQFEVPSSVFTSDITVLTVGDNLGEVDNMRSPNAICSAPRIKSLTLEYVTLPEGNSKGELVLSCPVLEKLTMWTCEDSHLKIFRVSAPSLKLFNYTNENSEAIYSCRKINVCSPNLMSFKCFCLYTEFYLVNLPSLINADITIYKEGVDALRNDPYDRCLIQILRGVYNLRSLKLSSENLKDIAGCPRMFGTLPNLFHNLRDFMLYDGCYASDIVSVSTIVNVLKSLPCLQAFVWDRTLAKLDILLKKGDDRAEDIPVQCILDCLQSIKIKNSLGVEDELKFLGFVLESAVFLKEITITTTHDERMLTEFSQKLLALPRASSDVLIHCP